ncbi:MAG: hypothetical protein O3A13_00980 [Proteobacteria bacterium]|nr:hypothetical protein [Pseudomonadota bacterium]MDA0992185.1 hypothetical protein [Pseudomonadota bacterium]
MTIAELGSIGEFLGSIAVFVSLIYLAVQVKRSTDAARTSTYQSVVSDFSALNQSMTSTPDLSLLFVNALEEFESLSADEKAKVSQLFFMCFRNFENMYYQYRKGYLEEELWVGWKRLMLTYFARPGFQSWWSIRTDVYSRSFGEFLRTEKIDKPIKTYYDITQMAGPATKE